MKLSTPIFQLKRRAKLMVRNNAIPLHEALDQIACEEGFAAWSLLSAHVAAGSLSKDLFSRIVNGDMLLLAGRPGQGKTALAFELLRAAAGDGRQSILFTLEMTEQQVRKRTGQHAGAQREIEIVTSDEICADYMIRYLSPAKSGTFAVIDYLQLLDQQRHKPDLSQQVTVLAEFAKRLALFSLSSRRLTAHLIRKSNEFPICAISAFPTCLIWACSPKPAFCITAKRNFTM